MHGLFYVAQDIGRRGSQQDAVGNARVSARHSLYVLADGMGGHRGGSVASETAVAAFIRYFTEHPQAADVAEAGLRAALDAANRRLAAVAAQQPELDGMGTTLLALLVDGADGGFAFVSVGDSPLYALEAGGALRRLNANHAFAEVLKHQVARGELSADEAKAHPLRHAVTSAVGGREIPLVDAGTGRLAAGGRLLLASDGIHVLADGEIAAALATGGVRQACETLLAQAAAKQHPHQDNVSVLAVQLPPAVRPRRLPEAPDTVIQSGGSKPRAAWRIGIYAGLLLGALAAAWYVWFSDGR